MSALLLGVCAVTACVFGVSAAAKLRDRAAYRSFRAGLAASRVVPDHLLAASAAALAACEALLAVWLTACAVTLAMVPGRAAALLTEPALATAALLTATMTAGIMMAIRHGNRAPCPCFGARSARPLGLPHLLRNVVLFGTIASGLALGAVVRSGPAWDGRILALAAALIAATVLIRWDELTEIAASATDAGGPRPGGR